MELFNLRIGVTKKNRDKYDLLVVTGPTATGKTTLAAHLAFRLGGEVISADSRQVYRNMDLGTGKDLEDYVVEGVRIPVHLTDIADAGSQYNVFEYKRDFQRVLTDLRSREIFPVLCGGSGLYIEAVLKDYRLIEVPINDSLRSELQGKSLEELTAILKSYKSKLHNTTDIINEKRAIRAIEIEEYYRRVAISSDNSSAETPNPVCGQLLSPPGSPGITQPESQPVSTSGNPAITHPESQVASTSGSPVITHLKSSSVPPSPLNQVTPLIVAIDFDVETRRKRITERLHQRLGNGMIEEVEKLLASGIPPEALTYYGLEYKFITLHLTGQLTQQEMIRRLNTAIHQFAKRQMTWFRKMEREGTRIHWIDGHLPLNGKVERVLELFNR